MASKIQTVGQLREYLANMMIGVKEGHIDFQDASTIVKLAQQINESFYSEVKVAKVRYDVAGEKFKALGKTPLNVDEDAPATSAPTALSAAAPPRALTAERSPTGVSEASPQSIDENRKTNP